MADDDRQKETTGPIGRPVNDPRNILAGHDTQEKSLRQVMEAQRAERERITRLLEEQQRNNQNKKP